MNIKNNSEYELGATLIHIKTENMSIDASTPVRSDKEVQDVASIAIAKSLNRALSDLPPVDRLITGIAHMGKEVKSAEVSVFKPSVKSMKAFIAAIRSVIVSSEMAEIDKYEKNICPLPKEVKDYIKELITK